MSFGGKEGEHKHTAELVDVIIRCFFLGKGRVGLVEGFRYVAYVCIYMVCDLPIVDFRRDDDE